MSFATLIEVVDLDRLIARRAVSVFDCRFDLADPASGRADYRDGHIPGAFYLGLEPDLSAPTNGSNGRHPLPDRDAFAARIAATGLADDQQAVAYDASGGMYAARMWWMLRWLGHEAVAVLDGGLPAWTAAGLPMEQGVEAEPGSGTFTARAPLASTVDADRVKASLVGGELLVIDARSAERFAGAPHPLDPVSGHIPGARNHFYQRNLTPEGGFKPVTEIAANFSELLGDTAPDKIVHQCGSGVTACHNLLAMEAAGFTGSRLYPGSWSEWVSDPTRPIVIGPA